MADAAVLSHRCDGQCAAAVREKEALHMLQLEKNKGVIAAARHGSALAKLRREHGEQLQDLRLQLLHYQQQDAERGAAADADVHKSYVVSKIHPLILDANSEDDLYMKLKDRATGRASKRSPEEIMEEIAAEMSLRLDQYEE